MKIFNFFSKNNGKSNEREINNFDEPIFNNFNSYLYKMNNKVIKIQNKDDLNKAIEFWSFYVGAKKVNVLAMCIEFKKPTMPLYIGVIDGKFNLFNIDKFIDPNGANEIEIIYVEELCNIFPSFPKVMTVTNDGKNWFTRVVIAIKNDGKVVCWKNATNLEDSDKECETEIYSQATDTVFLSKKEIAKKFGLPNNDFSII